MRSFPERDSRYGCGPEYKRHIVMSLSPQRVGEVREDADDEVVCMQL